jgi:hypothetical protein
MKSAKRIRRLLLAPLAAIVLASSADAALVISTAPTGNVTCSAGSCTATAHDAVLNVVDLKTLLHRGDVRVASGPADAIAASATLSWTHASRLTLVARTAITVSQPIVVAGDGAVVLTTSDDQSPGAIAFVGRGRLDFWNLKDRLIINGHDYTLAGDVASLASAIAADTHGFFALAKDYDAKGDALHTTSPVYVLYGSLNGLGHTISNVKIQAAQGCAGFIAYFVGGSASSVSNLTLSQIDATQAANSDGKAPNGVGGLAGCSQGTISHVRVTGHVSGPAAVSAGGIVGWQADGGDGTGPVSDSSVNVVVDGGTNAVAGGIVGYDLYGSLLRCAAAGKIAGPYAGGLVGLAEWDFNNITGSWSSAHAIGSLSGGLVGQADGDFTLADNYATGAVSSGGGLVGKNTGIGGTSGNSILRSYATGVVHGGGVTGIDDGTGLYASAYWDMDTTHVRNLAQGVYNIPNAPGVTGLTDAQLKSGLPAGFDPAVWAQNAGINNGYPYLIANPPQ